jgi:hypothetical protein
MSTLAALLRYQGALLTRSNRWLPPVLLYAAFMGVGIQGGQPLLDSLGYASAALLPVAAWLVRICVTGEPDAARHCVYASAGPARAHLASVLAALCAACVLGVAGTLAVVAVADPRTATGSAEVPRGLAAAAGLLSTLTCALFGTAVGALCNRPLLRGTGWAVPSTMLAALLVLVAGVSPANAAVSRLVAGSQTGRVTLSWLPAVLSLLVAAVCTAISCALARRRG